MDDSRHSLLATPQGPSQAVRQMMWEHFVASSTNAQQYDSWSEMQTYSSAPRKVAGGARHSLARFL